MLSLNVLGKLHRIAMVLCVATHRHRIASVCVQAFADWLCGAICNHPDAIVYRRLCQYVTYRIHLPLIEYCDVDQRDAYWEADYVH